MGYYKWNSVTAEKKKRKQSAETLKFKFVSLYCTCNLLIVF